MSQQSAIEFTHASWNPVTGCTRISAACKHCYAERFALRLKAMGMHKYRRGFRLTLHEDVLEDPLRWKKPRIIFTASMGDLFHRDVPDSFLMKVFDVMTRANRHIYQILTKRSERLPELNDKIPWAPHIWMGVTVESAVYKFRIEHLRKTGAHIKFLCMEPLLGPVPNLDLRGIQWVIVGGESGPSARPMKEEWAIGIRDQCLRAKVPFYFKQWGGANKKKTGRLLDGKIWDQTPLIQSPIGQLSLF